jgi:hypothetical protein
MKITFDILPVYDEKHECVKFAGRYRDHNSREQFLICRVTRAYLEKAGELRESTGPLLLEAYSALSAIIHSNVVRQISEGIQKPCVDLDNGD